MSAHRKSDWAAFGTCVVCGARTERGENGRRQPKKTCSAACRKSIRISSATTHGASNTHIYMVWSAMRQRTTNPASKDWPLYGGRGIKVCERWLNSFESFVEDMGPRPRGGMIDRIDNDGPYSPDNCRWAQPQAQMRNRRSTRLIEHDGQRRSLAEWSEVTGLSEKTIKSRLRIGWSIERTLTEPAWLGKNQASCR